MKKRTLKSQSQHWSTHTFIHAGRSLELHESYVSAFLCSTSFEAAEWENAFFVPKSNTRKYEIKVIAHESDCAVHTTIHFTSKMHRSTCIYTECVRDRLRHSRVRGMQSCCTINPMHMFPFVRLGLLKLIHGLIVQKVSVCILSDGGGVDIYSTMCLRCERERTFVCIRTLYFSIHLLVFSFYSNQAKIIENNRVNSSNPMEVDGKNNTKKNQIEWKPARNKRKREKK